MRWVYGLEMNLDPISQKGMGFCFWGGKREKKIRRNHKEVRRDEKDDAGLSNIGNDNVCWV